MSGRPPDLHCSAAVALVNDLIEGVLTPEDQLAIELHMVVCDGCTAVVDQMRTTIALLGSLPIRPIPAAALAAMRSA